MRGLCYEQSYPINRSAMTRRPKLAMDAALPDNTEQPDKLAELIRALGTFATTKLPAELGSQLNALVESAVAGPRDTAADDEPAPAKRPPVTAAGFERRADFLRSRNISEDDIDTLRGMYGLKKPSMAEDSARRERNHQRDQSEYASRFPAAARIGRDQYPQPER